MIRRLKSARQKHCSGKDSGTVLRRRRRRRRRRLRGPSWRRRRQKVPKDAGRARHCRCLRQNCLLLGLGDALILWLRQHRGHAGGHIAVELRERSSAHLLLRTWPAFVAPCRLLAAFCPTLHGITRSCCKHASGPAFERLCTGGSVHAHTHTHTHISRL